MPTSRPIFRFIALWLVLVASARLCAQVNLVFQWQNSPFTDPAPQKVASGQSYTPAALAHGGTFNSSTVITVTVSKSGGTTYYSSFSTPPGTAQGATAGTTPTTDTGNHYVYFTATGSNSTSGEHLALNATIKIYVPDTTPPSTVSGLYYTGLGTTQFTLVWPTATDNQLVDYYEVASNGTVVATVPAGSYPATYSYILTGLSQGTTYSMTVRARDWVGNYSAAWSSPLSVTMLVPDTTPPSQPGALFLSNIGLYSANLQWGPSTDNVGVVSYTVNLLQGGVNGAVLATYTTTVPNFAIPSLTANTTYGVSVVANDAAGNHSAATTGAFVTEVAYAPGPLAATQVKDTSFCVNWGAYVVAPATDHYMVQLNGGAAVSAGGSGNYASLGYNFTGLQPNTAYTVMVQAVGTTGATSQWSAPLTVTTDVSTVSLPTVTRPTGTGNLVASAGGSLSVDNHGSANYSIPLQIAPGRGGLQPSLSLYYSSGAGNGVAGVGWALSTGFPQSIVRGRSILARDGVVRGVTFTDTDKFYLDGKRLICVSGNYGQAGSVYRTEVDSFVTIAASNLGSGTSIDTFVMTDKSGTQFAFGKQGSNTDAFQKGSGELNGLAYSYALKQVTDTLGNYVSFTYTPLGGGEYVLSEIDYTGGPSVTPAAQVLLSYETTRPDQPVTYLANRAFNHRARLAKITAKGKVAGSLVTTVDYGLNYGNDVNGGRSRLTSVAPVLADPQSLVLQNCPSTVINWQNNDNGIAATGTSVPLSAPPTYDIAWGDTNNDGVDEPILAGNGITSCVKFGDFDGDGKKDTLTLTVSSGGIGGSVLLASGTGMTFSSTGQAKWASYFVDSSSQSGSHMLLNAEGLGASSRVTVGDFNGDGRDDILVHGFDGRIHVFLSQGTSFADPIDDAAHSPYLGGAGDIAWESGWNGQMIFNTWIDSHYYVKPMPCDLNGDGRTDYVCITYTRIMKYAPYVGYQTAPTGFITIRRLLGVISKPDGTFSLPFPIGGPAMAVPTETNEPVANYSGVVGDMKLNDINCGALMGDFNGDGLTDFLVLVPEFEMQPGLYSNYYGSHRWALYLNQGETPNGTPMFAEFKGPIPNTVTLSTGGTVNTYYTPTKSTGTLGYLNQPVHYITSMSPQDKSFIAGLEGAAGSVNNYVMDVNHDGLADLVWYVALDTSENAATAPGWYAMLSTGNFSSGGGFTGPVKLDFMNGVSGGNLASSSGANIGFNTSLINHDIDFNGDGHPDFFIQPTAATRPSSYGSVFLGTTLNGSSAQYNDLVTSITDGLGRKTDLAYKGAKDSSIYTKGAAVIYPIRELMASSPVVSDVWHDAGTGIAADRAQFSYQYSGNRLDLSGRGSLGFHSFVTLDRQTGLFKYQFLTQSFPMTGLAAREQTYRNWATGNFRLISSHDNTVVFDKVSTSGGATLWPFISQAVESRWEDGTTAHFTITASGASSQPEALFPLAKPAGAHITITAKSTFDGQTLPLLTLPTAVSGAGYNPSDTLGASTNTVVGTSTFDIFSGLPGNITYGNLTTLATDFGDGGVTTETVTTTYFAPVGPLTGLVNTVSTTATAPGYTDTAPVKSYTYFGSTPLVRTETVTGGGNLTTTTTYNRDSLGRITSTSIAGTNLQSAGQGSVSYTTATNSNFDSRFDLPMTTQDNYSHTTTAVYGTFLAAPTSVTQVNGDQYTSLYDAIGRTVQQTDVLKGLTTTNTFAWDATQTVAGPTGFNGVASGAPVTGVVGLSLTSAYKAVTTATVKPSVTSYYDRLGRVIRTVKESFGATPTYSDTAYNNLGQVIATSLPYPSGGAVYWTKTTYDALGRVATVTAPNGTVTANTYNGRVTSVSVDAPSLGGVDPAAQINTTLVDAKGRTVKVWNANNPAGAVSGVDGGGGSTPSIAYALDGFGRMRTTTLLGQSQTITATFDALGRQLSLNDPDKGYWSYTNSALGQVLTQTDAKGNTTSSIFDRLGRPLTRTTAEPSSGPVETASWYYYDSGDNSGLHLVAKGTKGWIGAPARDESLTTGSAAALGYTDPGTKSVHYFDTLGRPNIDISTIDGKWFYTYTDYDGYSRVTGVRHFWRPAAHESPNDLPYLWNDFGYTYTYDAKSYLLTLLDSTGHTWWQADANAGYDYLDRPVVVRKGNGYWTSRTYRPEDGVLSGISTGNGTVQNLSFNYDGLGNLTSRTGPGGTESFGYDNLNRLVSGTKGTSVAYATNGNITSKTDVTGSTGGYTYDLSQPHAAHVAWGYTMGYDANGNLSTRTKGAETWSLKWAGFDKPRWMAKTSGSTVAGSEFHYNAARSRVMHLDFDAMSGGVPSHYILKRLYALGSTVEIDYKNSAGSGQSWNLDKVRIYVPGPDGIVGTMEFASDNRTKRGTQDLGPARMLVYHYDHLGSIENITPYGDTSGSYASDEDGRTSRYSYEPWGQRRNALTWSGVPDTTAHGGKTDLTPRGYTGHEMLDDLGLVHMNGRIYDPLLGRMLSADLLVSNPGSLQSYNRYSYVWNNPLRFTDPSGFDGSGDFAGFTISHNQNLVALQKAYGTEKANQIMRNTDLGQAAGTLIGASLFVAAAPAIEAVVAEVKRIFTGDDHEKRTVPQAASQQASSQADQQSTAPKPQVEQAKPDETSSDGKMDAQKPAADTTTRQSAKDAAPVQTTKDRTEYIYGPKDDPKVNSDGSTKPNTYTTPDDHKTQEAAQDKNDTFKPAEGRRPVTIPAGSTVQEGTTPGGEGPYNGSGGGNETLHKDELPAGSAGKWTPLPTEDELKRSQQQNGQ